MIQLYDQIESNIKVKVAVKFLCVHFISDNCVMAQYSEQVTPKTEENILVNFSRLLNFRFLLLSLNKTNKTKHQNNTAQTQLIIKNISNNSLT